MRRCEDDRIRIAELIDDDAVAVDGRGHRLEAGAGDDLALLGVARILDRDAPRAARGQMAADEEQALRVAGGDDHVGGVRRHAAHAPKIGGECAAQRQDAARVAVLEVGVGDHGHGVAERAQPGGARERRDVRDARAEVEPRDGRRGGGRHAWGDGRSHAVGYARTRALAQAQVALGGELRVGVDDGLPRHAELAGEVAGRRNALRRPQRAVADRTADLLLDLAPERARPVAAQRNQQLDRLTGLVH